MSKIALILCFCLVFSKLKANCLDSLTKEFDPTFSKPVAQTFKRVETKTGSSVVLDARKSFDKEQHNLTYHWSLISSPLHSLCVLYDTTDMISGLFVDKAGQYLVGLKVANSRFESDQDTLMVLVKENLLSTLNLNSSAVIPLEASIYPNPASDYVFLEFENTAINNAEYVIINQQGNIIVADFIDIIPNALNKIKISFEGIENRSEMYFLKVNMGNRSIQKKIWIK